MQRFIDDDSTKAIVAVYGGYGTLRMICLHFLMSLFIGISCLIIKSMQFLDPDIFPANFNSTAAMYL